MVIIVTDKCYIQAEKIRHVSVEDATNHERNNAGRLITGYVYHEIKVYYTYLDKAGNEEDRYAEIRIFGKEEASRIYREIVEQIRDQDPDKAYTDMLVQKYLLQDGNTDPNHIHDGNTKKVRRTRKKKSRS